MSLYVYVVPCSSEQADSYQVWLDHVRGQSFLSSHRCWQDGCYPTMPSLYEGSLELGRPMCNEGASQAERWYGKQTIGENDFTMWLVEMLTEHAGTPEGPSEDWRAWITDHARQTVVVGNDNEWSSR